MVDYKDIRDHETTSSWYGKTFTVFVRSEGDGTARVKEVDIEGASLFKDPLRGEVFDSAQDALNAGVRFATVEIGD